QQRTAISIRGDYEGEESGEVLEAIRGMMAGIELPPGYDWSFGGRVEQVQDEQGEMGINILLAVLCVYFVMAALFESFVHPLVIMLCIPFAALGVVWTLMLTDTPMNLMAMIGIVILIGIVVNNGIVLLDHIHGLRKRGRDRSRAILEGCADRFRPILMTAATTILGLLPLAVGRASVGDGYYYPMARSIMGGLAASTLLTLIVLPTFYVLSERASAQIRRTISWGLGRGALPWRDSAAVKVQAPSSSRDWR
ncbi:MAG: MMPL family transporter, partial [Candidatus Eisenbacteria bacterium]|nr:MMPL family transporter [Candidatus Latescibacterota bacterium]MBD3301973.1 MMPL family transporter [Candidatus Eisenbacteria bacterium]